jgi:hypothetical protein
MTEAGSGQYTQPGALTPVYGLSLAAAALMTGASLAGLIFPEMLYPTPELRQSFVANDVVNLGIGLPGLLGALALAKRGRLLGLLLWPGALFYIVYNYIAYTAAMPRTIRAMCYLALVLLSAYTIYALLARLDKEAIRGRLAGAVKERLGAAVLIGLGGLFLLRSAGQVIGALAGQTVLTQPEQAVLFADVMTIPLWIAGGLRLWRRQALGYASGAGLLYQASLLFVALLVFFILQPFLASVPFPATDFVVILVMGLVCFVPFGLFVRGILK